jgi:hypothetical protein
MIIKVTTLEQVEISKEMPVTTVVIERDDDAAMVHMFFCNNCGQAILQHKGRVAYILPGAAPCNMPVIVECRRCKTKYMIRTNT